MNVFSLPSNLRRYIIFNIASSRTLAHLPSHSQQSQFPSNSRSPCSGSQRCILRSMATLNQTSPTFPSGFDDFFRYTSGRWVWGEEQQLRDRFRMFNVIELQRIAAQSVGSKKCFSMTKLAEGGYNKAFRLEMEDGKAVVARIPNPNAGPTFYTTASEVATMEFVRTVLQIPVPEVYHWSATTDNRVGAEYIIMEEARGVPLEGAWGGLNPDSKLSIMKELVSIETKLLSVSFSRYGNIYFRSDAVKGTVPAELLGDVPSELKKKVAAQYTIGPSADKGFWDKHRSEMDIDRTTPLDYAKALAHREIAWIKNHATPKAPDDPLMVSVAQNNPKAHIVLLEKFLAVAPFLLDVETHLASSNLWHPDLHSSNIFVDQDKITSVIDWQGARAGPLFLQARPSDIVNYQGDMLLKRPDNFKDLDEDQKTRIKQQIFKSTLFQLYLMETKEKNPCLAEVFQLEHGKTRRLPVEFAGNTWDDDIVAFREALINVERYWEKLCTGRECPIHFTEDELRSHLQDAEGWNEAQDFFDGIQDLVQRDGWTRHELFSDALALFSELRTVGLREMKGKEKEWFEKQTCWTK